MARKGAACPPCVILLCVFGSEQRIQNDRVARSRAETENEWDYASLLRPSGPRVSRSRLASGPAGLTSRGCVRSPCVESLGIASREDSMRRCVACLLPLLAVLACGGELDRDEARRSLHGHFTDVAPHLRDNPEFPLSRVVIENILQPTERDRTVRFRLVTEASDTSGVYEVAFVRSDEGWALTRYSNPTAQLVATMINSYRRGLYEDLLPPLGYLDNIVEDWRASYADGLGGQTTAEVLARSRRLTYRMDHTPTKTELMNMVHPDSLPQGIEWGVFPEDEPVLIWLRDADDPDRVCVEPRDREYAFTGSFNWIDPEDYEQCIGDDAPYSLLTRDLAEAIRGSGNLWPE